MNLFTQLCLILMIGLKSLQSYAFDAITGHDMEEIIHAIANIPQRDTRFPHREHWLWPAIEAIGPEVHAPLELKAMGFKKVMLKDHTGIHTEAYIYEASPYAKTLAIIAGLSAKADAAGLKPLALPIWAEGKTNIVLIESTSTGSFTKRNRLAIASGVHAGYRVYQQLKLVREQIWPKSPRLDTIGVSLGGSDAAFAQMIDEAMGTQILSNGVMTVSSPANRLLSLMHLRERSGLPGFLGRSALRTIYWGALDYFLAILKDPFLQNEQWLVQKASLDELLQEIYLKTEALHLNQILAQLPTPFREVCRKPILDIESLKCTFQLEAYLPHMHRPIFWLGAKNDRIVAWEDSLTVLSAFKDHPSTAHFATPYGGHACHAGSYGRRYMDQVIKTYFDLLERYSH